MKIKATYKQHEIDLPSGEVTLRFALERDRRLSLCSDLDKLLTAITSHNNAAKKLLKVDIDVWREQRSLSANSYFHLLVNKIAEKVGSDDDKIKYMLVVSYGALASYEGEQVVIKLPVGVEAAGYYKYLKYVGDEVDKSGKEWNLYVPYKETHLYDSKEMARLIDGTVDEAKRLDIEVKSPDELASMLALMEEYEKQKNKSV